MEATRTKLNCIVNTITTILTLHVVSYGHLPVHVRRLPGQWSLGIPGERHTDPNIDRTSNPLSKN